MPDPFISGKNVDGFPSVQKVVVASQFVHPVFACYPPDFLSRGAHLEMVREISLPDSCCYGMNDDPFLSMFVFPFLFRVNKRELHNACKMSA